MGEHERPGLREGDDSDIRVVEIKTNGTKKQVTGAVIVLLVGLLGGTILASATQGEKLDHLAQGVDEVKSMLMVNARAIGEIQIADAMISGRVDNLEAGRAPATADRYRRDDAARDHAEIEYEIDQALRQMTAALERIEKLHMESQIRGPGGPSPIEQKNNDGGAP